MAPSSPPPPPFVEHTCKRPLPSSLAQVENLQFSPDEKSVFLTTTEGNQQVVAVLPSAQQKLVDLLLANDVNFRAVHSALQSNHDEWVGGVAALRSFGVHLCDLLML
jgi:hypothetical protein